jgi:hypothetical protein
MVCIRSSAGQGCAFVSTGIVIRNAGNRAADLIRAIHSGIVETGTQAPVGAIGAHQAR